MTLGGFLYHKPFPQFHGAFYERFYSCDTKMHLGDMPKGSSYSFKCKIMLDSSVVIGCLTSEGCAMFCPVAVGGRGGGLGRAFFILLMRSFIGWIQLGFRHSDLNLAQKYCSLFQIFKKRTFYSDSRKSSYMK